MKTLQMSSAVLLWSPQENKLDKLIFSLYNASMSTEMLAGQCRIINNAFPLV